MDTTTEHPPGRGRPSAQRPVRRRIEAYMAARHGLPQDLRIADLGAHDEAVVNM